MLPIVAVPRLWPEAIIVCLGSGPSLTPEDISYLWRARAANPAIRVIAINNTWTLARWADVLYAPDPIWWGWHGVEVARMFTGRKYTLEDNDAGVAEAAGAQRLNYKSGLGMSDDPTTILTGGHAGYQAPQVAVHLGARKVVLLGYDLQPDAAGRNHFFGEHPDGSHVPYDTWRESYQSLRDSMLDRQVPIVNASRETSITAIPRVTLAEAFAL